MQITRLVICFVLLHFAGPDFTLAEESQDLDNQFDALLPAHGVATIGAGVIRDGELAWTGYFGQQAPGVPAGPSTMFNVASITKTVAANSLFGLRTTVPSRWTSPCRRSGLILMLLTTRDMSN